MPEADLAPLRAAADEGPAAYGQAIAAAVMGDPRLGAQAPVLLYRTMKLPDAVKEGAVLLGVVLRLAMKDGPSLARAGFGGDDPLVVAKALFEAVLASPSGLVFAVDEWSDVMGRVATPDGRLQLALPDLLETWQALLGGSADVADAAFPFVLSAGERRSFTANTIIRDPSWRKKDAHGALRINPEDAKGLGVGAGEAVRLTTKRGSAVVTVELSDTMQRGHVALPNGLGLSYPLEGGDQATGVAPNELTASEDRDPFVGTPSGRDRFILNQEQSWSDLQHSGSRFDQTSQS